MKLEEIKADTYCICPAQPCPEINLFAAVIYRAIRDAHMWIRDPQEFEGKFANWMSNKRKEDIELLIDWAENPKPEPINLRWMAEHMDFEDPDAMIQAVQFAMKDKDFKPVSRYFSYRRLYNIEDELCKKQHFTYFPVVRKKS